VKRPSSILHPKDIKDEIASSQMTLLAMTRKKALIEPPNKKSTSEEK